MTETYELLEVLGHGGMADVHRARDHDLERDVAVKVLSEKLADSERFIHLFLAEARKMASVSHPNVLPIYGIDDDGRQRPRLIMELAETTLAEPLAAGPCDPVLVERIARQVLLGLEAIHQAGLVHQDIKPANIFLSRGFYKIGDFGIATDGDQHTQLLATPRYLAPEVLNRPHLVGPASDLYSLGLVLYEALLGAVIFEATVARVVEDAMAGVEGDSVAHRKQIWRSFHGGPGELPPCHRLDSEIPQRLSAWIARLTCKDPAKRCQTCREALAFLDQGTALRDPGLSPGAEVTQPIDRVPKPSNGRWLGLGLGVGLFAATGLGLFWHQRQWVTLEVVSEPSGATIVVDDETLGPTPSMHRLRVGTTVEIRREGFEPMELVLDDRATETLVGSMTWRPIPLRSVPNAAIVRRASDDAILGRTPIEVVGEGERFELRIEAEGYDATELALEPGDQPPVVVLAEQAPPRLAVPSSPEELFQLLAPLLSPSGATAIGLIGRQDASVRLGDELRFQVGSRDVAHAVVFLLDSKGNIVLLYPSPEGGDVRLEPGRKTPIPLAKHRVSGYRLEASEPTGRDRVFLLTSRAPLPRPPMGHSLGRWSTVYSFEPGNPSSSALELVHWVVEASRVEENPRLVMREILIEAAQ